MGKSYSLCSHYMIVSGANRMLDPNIYKKGGRKTLALQEIIRLK